MDAVSEATPEEILAFLPTADATFKRFGSLKYKTSDGLKFDITTLRKESSYEDSRHPNKVIFVKDLKEDYLRRDFTVNALYMNKDLKVIDYCNGQEDLKNNILRMVGNPDTRIKEDPLRILRAIRFHLMHHLKIEESLLKAMHDNFYLLRNITDAKIRSELNKIDDTVVDQKEKMDIFAQFDIANLVGVIK
jgi:tRNA nucleotidyltransferase (CCA-adding enzyme)